MIVSSRTALPLGCKRTEVLDIYAVPAVGRDHVFRTGRNSPDRIPKRVALDVNAIVVVPERRGARDVGPDVVAQDRVTVGTAADLNSVNEVAGDDIPGPGTRTANRVAVRPETDPNPAPIPQGPRA